MEAATQDSRNGNLKEVEAASLSSATPPEGTCAVDIRVFLLTITVAMSAAFFAGISIHLPIDHYFRDAFNNNAVVIPPTPSSKQHTRLELSPADLKTAGTHSPSGQHLLVDMKGIEAAFLDSEERLSDAMVQTVQEAGLSMLSYHCHKLDPAGISCVGVLLESHISFHTWPEEGVITLDLFTCGANPLLPVVPVIERLFGIGSDVTTKWSHELRGFRSQEEKKANYLDNMSDLSVWVLSPLELHSKQQIYSNLTKHQRVDIWDILETENYPSFHDGLKHNLPDGDKRWLTPDLAKPDRLLFLDGILQSIHSCEAIYHEALVHPAMLAHPKPKYVAVLGGGEGATIREVLKHKTVELVTMIELDAEMIEIAKQYLPTMNDCSDLIGRAANCFDDEAVHIVNDNAVDYFLDRFGPNPVKYAPSNLFDVLIVDALDPEDENLFAKDLYADDGFVSAILKSMSDDGVLLIQSGTAPELSDPKADTGSFKIREQLFNLFENHPDVASMHVYEEPASGFLEPHSFLLVCKSIACRDRWYARTDVVDYQLYDRILSTKSQMPALKWFDGVTQYRYQVPPMAWESVYCRREPTPFECSYRSLDFSREVHEFYIHDERESSFNVEARPDGTASLTAKVDIPKGSLIMPEHLAKSLVLNEGNVEDIKDGVTMGLPEFESFEKLIKRRSHKGQTDGVDERYLEVGASVWIRDVDRDEEANVGRWVPPHPTGKRPPYSPVYDRHRMSFDVFMVATKDIPAGAELTRSKTAWGTNSI